MTIGQRIRTLRLSRDLSQTALAHAIGVKPPSVNQIESGKSKRPNAETLIKIARVLQCSPEWLVTGKGSPGQVAAVTPEESELLTIYRGLSNGARSSLLGYGRGLLAADPVASPADPFKKPTRTR